MVKHIRKGQTSEPFEIITGCVNGQTKNDMES